jgi:multiple sugar transport system substrate-binding protein
VGSARWLVGALVAVVLAAGLAGCTGGRDQAEPTPSSTSDSPSGSTGPAVLKLAVYGDDAHLAAYKEIADAFSKAHPAVKVETATYGDALSAANAALAPSDTTADVFLADDRLLPRLVSGGGLQPVDTLLESRGLQFGDGYQRVGLTAFSADARLQCMPAEVSPLVVYNNRNLIKRPLVKAQGVHLPDAKDPSWTWREFETTARSTIGMSNGGPVNGGYVPPDVESMTALLRSAGGDVVDETLQPTTLTLSTDQGVSTIGTVAAFDRDSSVAPTADELVKQAPVEMFARGRLGLYIGTRADLPRLRSEKGLRFDVLPLPSFGRPRSVSLMNGYCINKNTEHLTSAADFIAFAVGPQGARIAGRSGAIVPSNLDELEKGSFTQPGQQPRNTEAYAESARRSDPLPYSRHWSEVSLDIESLLRKVYTSPAIDLQTGLPRRLNRLDRQSQEIFSR